ncbi:MULTISPECIES: CocE/NonD family hydrolase [Dyella]|uniref:CocE/NonD family hydrolase n=2 Tax=Dyella TaxID=231454 RepID=A0A4R0YKU5_9GAMM|nr:MULTISPECIES: CocE/NonD family hydrolase [Dyella]TBR36090.1 CocE/NonD family hydrolase [Dyella terrae]TCI06139.1 CocE/NonD family hydrolase [Dyella soli]
MTTTLRKAVLLGLFAATVPMLASALTPPPQSQAPLVGTNDIPRTFDDPVPGGQDFIKRVEMVPMRDGVKLYTVILIPKGAKNAPILLTRTPYNAEERAGNLMSPKLVDAVPLGDAVFAKAGYIRIYQDVRGKYGSEGDYVMMRPVRGPLNPTKVDQVTDAWDTIDWLVKHLKESNGRVAMIGSSYEGFTAAMALLEPHPALKASVPESPVIDAYMGDDWFHYGAFRNMMLGYVHMQTVQKGPGAVTPSDTFDKYEEYLQAGSTGDYVRSRGLDKLPFVARMMGHPSYDAFWQGQDLAKLLAARPSNVPTLWEQGLFDQEDMWGANHAWLALKAAGHIGNNWLVLGPWSHSQVNGKGYSVGPLQWNGDTSAQYMRDMVLPFLEQYLRDGPDAKLPRVAVYNTGDNHWDGFETWPTSCESGCGKALKPLFLTERFGLSFDAPGAVQAGDTYTSDPAKPVPFLPRPVLDPFYGYGSTYAGYLPWSKWLLNDQRFVDGRPDVLVYETPVLTEPVRVQGIPVADIRAATTGTDGDFVVKLIDVYPSSVPGNPTMGGYQLPIALDIFRGRYRESFEHPTAIPANQPQRYKFDLPNVNHVFQPGHKIMVQIQSSLFPLYDRNPQTFVPNIFNAKPGDYRAANVTVLRSKEQASAVWLPVVEGR